MNEFAAQIPLIHAGPEQPSDLVISAHHVVKQYGQAPQQVTALGGVSLGLKRGAFTAIMGPSGSGKSTLMHVMAGLDTVTSGEIMLAGQRITQMGDAELTRLRRRQIGFIFQAFNLVPTLDVYANVMLPFELDGRTPTHEEARRIDEVFRALSLTDRLTHRPHELSGGQQQRVAIARALATSPEIVFADEPTGALDSRTSREVLGLLRGAVDTAGQTIAMVTHDPVAASYADRILFLADGQVVLDSGAMSPEEISRTMLSLDKVSA